MAGGTAVCSDHGAPGELLGCTPDDASGICEVKRLRVPGAGFVVFAWPALWWLDHYLEMTRFLRENFQCLLNNERLVIFDIRSPLTGSGAEEHYADD